MVIGREMVRKINRQMKNYKLMIINKNKNVNINTILKNNIYFIWILKLYASLPDVEYYSKNTIMYR